jgi:hypothetical protein
MDLDLREAFDRGFGLEPAHRPVSDRVEAGHRAVRRRRLAGTVLTVAVATVVGVGAVALLGQGSGGAPQFADDATSRPSATPTAEPWGRDELVRYTNSGEIEIRDGVTVLQRIESPMPQDVAQSSVALALEHDGRESWHLLQWEGAGGSSSGASFHPGGAFATLESWVADLVLLNTDPEKWEDQAAHVTFADDGSLVSSQGVQILEQRHPIELKNFTEKPSDRTAAALLQGPDGTKFYVLVRDLYGEIDVETWAYASGGADLDAFLAVARAAFESGEGGR